MKLFFSIHHKAHLLLKKIQRLLSINSVLHPIHFLLSWVWVGDAFISFTDSVDAVFMAP